MRGSWRASPGAWSRHGPWAARQPSRRSRCVSPKTRPLRRARSSTTLRLRDPTSREYRRTTQPSICSSPDATNPHKWGADVSMQQQSDELEALLRGLPLDLASRVRSLDGLDGLLEIVMDLGRLPEARFAGREETLARREVSAEDIAYVISHIGQFGGDNRAGIERTLHRISALRNRAGKVVGLTLRVGRAVYGTVEIIRDIVESGRSILLLGRPGVGKTTMLREVARVLADDLAKRVVVVDPSNEIAGDGDIPHPAIGDARRMQVAAPSLQHAVRIEAVENHTPEVVVIDEIGTEQEAGAARTIAERGVQLIATAHGHPLQNLLP